MADSVNLSGAMRNNLLLLQRTNSQVETIQNRLATGNKVNSALDGPTSFFAAKSLTSRASDLSALKEQMGQGIATIQAGDKGLASIEKLVDQARGLTQSAYNSLGNDANSVATRKKLAESFNQIKDQIDRIAKDSGYQGKNLLVGDGREFAATSESKTDADALAGISNSRVTNVSAADTFSISVSGDGAITGNSKDITNTENARGLTGLKVSGTLSATSGNFSDITVETRGNVGGERTLTVSEGGESRTFKMFDNSQSVKAEQTTASGVNSAQVSTVTIEGDIEEGDTFELTVGGTKFSYTATSSDVSSVDQADRRDAIATGLRTALNDATGTGESLDGYTVSATTDNTFTVTGLTNPSATSPFSISGSTKNAENKAISISFSSGTTVSFTVDRSNLETLGTAGNGKSTIEKNVNIDVTATDLSGVSITRSGDYATGAGKLSGGENSFSFGNGTVRLTVDEKTIKGAASASASANLVTKQTVDANTENDLNVQFNETGESAVTVKSADVTSRGLGIDNATNGFADREDIDRAVASLDTATSRLRGAQQGLSTNLNLIQTRQDFTEDFSNVLIDGANKLTQADQNAEGAQLLQLQTRQQLGTISLSLANQAQQAILRLF